MSDANEAGNSSREAGPTGNSQGQPAGKVRTIRKKEGVYIHAGDFVKGLEDEGLLLECAAMIKVAKDLGHPALYGVKMCIANAIRTLAG